MPKLTHTKRTAVAGLAMTGAVIGAAYGASADSNNIDDLNQQLQSLVKNAERVGLKIVVKETKTYDTNVSALTGIKQEATRVQKAITHIENLNKTILSNIGKFEKQGVKFDGIKVIEIDATNVDDINKKLKNIVVIHLGTNGVINKESFESSMKLLEGKTVYLMNTVVPKPWEKSQVISMEIHRKSLISWGLQGRMVKLLRRLCCLMFSKI